MNNYKSAKQLQSDYFEALQRMKSLEAEKTKLRETLKKIPEFIAYKKHEADNIHWTYKRQWEEEHAALFADLKTIMKQGGVAMIGMGESDSENRAADAVTEALNSPLLDVDVSNASGALVNVIGGKDMTIKEAEGVVEELYSRISPDATIIWGASIDKSLKKSIRALLVLTGVKSKQILGASMGNELETYQQHGIDIIR